MDIGFKEIDRWHKAKGWRMCGYHYIIRRDGTLETGREESKVGAHCKGYNKHSIGICFVGGKRGHGKENDNFKLEQMQIGKMLLQDLIKKYPGATIHPHNEFAKSKLCPVFDIEKIKPT